MLIFQIEISRIIIYCLFAVIIVIIYVSMKQERSPLWGHQYGTNRDLQHTRYRIYLLLCLFSNL